jgi:hypothetical protein
MRRPKSREETPKEGGGNAGRYRTAIRYTASHKTQAELAAQGPLTHAEEQFFYAFGAELGFCAGSCARA